MLRVHSDDVRSSGHHEREEQRIVQATPKHEQTLMHTELNESTQIPKPLGDIGMYAPLQFLALLSGDSRAAS